MFRNDTGIAFLKVLVLLLVIAAFLVISRRSEIPQQAQNLERLLPVQITQLSAPWRDIVTLRCDRALVSTNEIKTLTCYLRNNSSKYVVAGSAKISVVLDNQGIASQQDSLLSFDSFLHPDFHAEHPQNTVAPGSDYRLADSPTTFDAPITNILVAIDYIEFSDGSTIGADRGGSQVIKGLREGARKYKDWLTAKYSETLSVNAVAALLTQDASIPSELMLANSNEQLGAKMFKLEERRVYETKGPEGLLRYLKPGKQSH